MNDVKERLDADLSKTNTLEKLNELKTLYMGKKGIITELTLKIKDLPNEEKREYGKSLNELKNYFNENTVKTVAIVVGIYAMAVLMYYTSQRNYMPGKEFGTARFENPKQVNKILADKDENFNRILSQNVKMSLDFRRLKLNGNILICGGSGAGKTFYEVIVTKL